LACHAPSANPTYRPNRQKSLFCPYSNFPSDGFLPRQYHALDDVWQWMDRRRVARVCGLHEFSYVSAYAIKHCNAVISGIMGERKAVVPQEIFSVGDLGSCWKRLKYTSPAAQYSMARQRPIHPMPGQAG
jgi:hypothetical protein